jgi:tetratricopeptide (TPR) repeat protein
MKIHHLFLDSESEFLQNCPTKMEENIDHFSRGNEFKKAGDLESALSEYRKAVVADPKLTPAHFEIGLLLKSKADANPYFLRPAFEAFQNAVRGDITNERAHDHYIILAQKMGRLDELLDEYDAWIKQHPDNEFFQRCKKNIVTISMAMMPEKVSVASSTASNSMRKMVLFLSLGMLLFGVGLIIGPSLAKQGGKNNIDMGTIRRLFMVGAIMDVAGAGGIILFLKLKS